MDTMIEDRQAPKHSKEELDWLSFYHQLMMNKWIVISIMVLALFGGFLYSMREVPQYQSDILIQVDASRDRGQSVFAQQYGAGLFGGSGPNAVATQMALIRSRFVLDPVIQSVGLDIKITPKKKALLEYFSPKKAQKPAVRITSFEVLDREKDKGFLLKVDALQHVSLYDSTNKLLLQGAVGSLLTNKDKTIRLTIRSIDVPVGTEFTLVKLSRFNLVKALINQLKVEEMGVQRMQSTGILSVSLEGEDPKKLTLILNAIAKTAKSKDAKKKSMEASKTLDFLYHQLPLAKKELEQAEYQLNQYRSKSGKVDIKLQTGYLLQRYSNLDGKLNKLQIDKIDMTQRYTKIHPVFIALDTQIKALIKQREELERLLKTLPASDQLAVNLLRDVKVKRTLYLLLLNKIQELRVVEAGTVSDLRILSDAVSRTEPLPSYRKKVYLVSILLGFMLSVLIVLGRKIFLPRIEDPHWVEHQFNLPCLAIIPYCLEQSKLNGSPVRHQAPLLAHLKPRDLTMESLRSLRTSLQVSLTGADNNIISILGVSPGVGKSFVSSNLAYLLAVTGKKVLVIDCDFRRGTVHKYFDLMPSPGLADVLNNAIELDTAIRSSMIENLDVLSRGVYPESPSELLTNQTFKSILNTLSERYDLVIIDTAPVLLVTDAVIVSGYSATNYIVFGAGVHQPSEIELSIKRLTAAGVKLQGSIFNFHKDTKKASYGHYYRNSYKYYYADELTKAK